MSHNNGLHDRIRAALRESPNGLMLREITVAVRGEYHGRDNTISCALRRMRGVTGDVSAVFDSAGRARYFMADRPPPPADIWQLLTVPWCPGASSDGQPSALDSDCGQTA